MNLSKQEFLSVGNSAKYIQDKRKLREELEMEMVKFLKRGGEIKSAQNQIFQVKHGTSDQYNKRSCRCDICVNWALERGLRKSAKLKVKS